MIRIYENIFVLLHRNSEIFCYDTNFREKFIVNLLKYKQK